MLLLGESAYIQVPAQSVNYTVIVTCLLDTPSSCASIPKYVRQLLLRQNERRIASAFARQNEFRLGLLQCEAGKYSCLLHRKTQGEEAAALQSGKDNPDPSAAHQQEYDEGAGPIYVSYKEVKGAPSHATKYSRKLSYIKYFYLTDIHAKETLAAIGEDQGSSFSNRNLTGVLLDMEISFDM